MLVTIQFPCDFVIAHDGEIQKGNSEPGVEWGSLAVHAIEVPVDFAAVVKTFVAQ